MSAPRRRRRETRRGRSLSELELHRFGRQTGSTGSRLLGAVANGCRRRPCPDRAFSAKTLQNFSTRRRLAGRADTELRLSLAGAAPLTDGRQRHCRSRQGLFDPDRCAWVTTTPRYPRRPERFRAGAGSGIFLSAALLLARQASKTQEQSPPVRVVRLAGAVQPQEAHRNRKSPERSVARPP